MAASIASLPSQIGGAPSCMRFRLMKSRKRPLDVFVYDGDGGEINGKRGEALHVYGPLQQAVQEEQKQEMTKKPCAYLQHCGEICRSSSWVLWSRAVRSGRLEKRGTIVCFCTRMKCRMLRCDAWERCGFCSMWSMWKQVNTLSFPSPPDVLTL